MRKINEVWQWGVAILLAVISPFAVKADKGFEIELSSGDMTFLVECHYEPYKYATVKDLWLTDFKDVENSSDTIVEWLRFPTVAYAYNDTFPVKRIAITTDAMASKLRVTPKKINFGDASFISYWNKNILNYNWSTRLFTGIAPVLDEIVLSENADTLDACFAGTQLADVDLRNVKTAYFQGADAYRLGTFAFCDKLRSVKADSLTRLSSYTFRGDSLITSLDFPSVKRIDNNAINLPLLTEISVPQVDTICEDAFQGCVNLEKMEMNPGLKLYYPSGFYTTAITELNLHSATMPWGYESSFEAREIPKLRVLESDTLEYITNLNPGMELRTPALKAIRSDSTFDISITGLDKMRQLYLTDCAVDSLAVPASLLNGYQKGRPLKWGAYNYKPWYAMKFKRSSVDKVSLSEDNVSFIIKDGLLLSLPLWLDISSDRFSGYDYFLYPFGLDIEAVLGLGYQPDGYIHGQTSDTIAVAAIGFPRGKSYTPKNNPYGGVTINCDYVDNIILETSYSPKGNYLTTYHRSAERPRIKVFVSISPARGQDVINCCISPLMDFIVPKGMLGRYIAAGFPADRTFEDATGTLAIEEILAGPDTHRVMGTYDLSGRKMPEDATLSPGIYIKDGQKIMVR
ncbi:MAG: leucine-rich repeat domain-containing protein [Pseudoflavonifractor sp.]|nr:leucine-rich repeat domain-containing protein [Pseudoflavonifractor sp.]